MMNFIETRNLPHSDIVSFSAMYSTQITGQCEESFTVIFEVCRPMSNNILVF
jgi:hypothetical protein